MQVCIYPGVWAAGFKVKDGYKVGHKFQYPEGTTLVYSNFTPRKSRNVELNEIVFFGLQYFIKEYLIRQFDENFFQLSKDEVMRLYKRRINNYLGKDSITYDHIEALHDLEYKTRVFLGDQYARNAHECYSLETVHFGHNGF